MPYAVSRALAPIAASAPSPTIGPTVTNASAIIGAATASAMGRGAGSAEAHATDYAGIAFRAASAVHPRMLACIGPLQNHVATGGWFTCVGEAHIHIMATSHLQGRIAVAARKRKS